MVEQPSLLLAPVAAIVRLGWAGVNGRCARCRYWPNMSVIHAAAISAQSSVVDPSGIEASIPSNPVRTVILIPSSARSWVARTAWSPISDLSSEHFASRLSSRPA